MRHSNAYNTLNDEQLAEYRRRCLPRDLGGSGDTLEAIVAWAGKRGLKTSISSVQRDRDHMVRVETHRQRIENASRASAEILKGFGDDDVAGLQSGLNAKLSEMVFEMLLDAGTVTLEDASALAKLAQGVASLQKAELAAYKARVEKALRDLEGKAESKKRPDGKIELTEDDIADVRSAVLGR